MLNRMNTSLLNRITSNITVAAFVALFWVSVYNVVKTESNDSSHSADAPKTVITDPNNVEAPAAGGSDIQIINFKGELFPLSNQNVEILEVELKPE